MPDWSKSDLYAAIRRDTRAGVVADRDAHRDYVTEGLNEPSTCSNALPSR
jgi:hypothetical protein